VKYLAKPKQTLRVILLFVFDPFENKFSMDAHPNKKAHIGELLLRFCGERGIRTPGPPVGGQRFSRPPH
jgi:hypothetical protein